MSELVAPRIVGEDELIIEEWGKRVFHRRLAFAHGIEEYMLWGGAKPPVIVFPATPDGKVIVLRQFRLAANKFLYELPGGNPLWADRPEETALRELRDEAGIAADRLVQVGPAQVYFDPATDVNHYVPFLVTGCRRIAEPRLEKTEIAENMALPIEQWDRMVDQGEIQDSKSIVTTYFALRRLGWLTVSPPRR